MPINGTAPDYWVPESEGLALVLAIVALAAGGARARTSTTSALATVSSWDSLDRRSPRRSDRSPPCSFRFSARCARGRWGRGRERTRQCDPFEGTRGCGCLRKCVGTHHALSLGVRARCDSIGRAFDRSVGSPDAHAGGCRCASRATIDGTHLARKPDGD